MSSPDGPRLRELTIVWGALCGGMLLYTAVAYGLVESGVVAIGGFPPGFMTLAGPAVLLWMLGSLALRRVIVGRIPPDLDAQERLQRYWTSSIVSLAIMEGAGLTMITLGMIASDASWILAGGGAGAVLLFFARPTRAELDRS